MAARRMGFLVVLLSLLTLFGDSYGTEFVPVFIWGSEQTTVEVTPPALKKYSTDDFADFIQKKLSAFGEEPPVVLVFEEENLSVEDFSWQDQAGNTVFPHLQSVSSTAPDASFIPSVENPLKALKRLVKQGFKWIVAKDANATQIPQGGVVVVLKMEDARGDEDRPDLLRRHDRIMMEKYSSLVKERGVIAVYTGHYCSWTEPENEPVLYRKRRLLAEPVVTADPTSIHMNTSSILIYAKSMPVVNVSGEVISLNRDPIVTGNTRASFQSLTAKFNTNGTAVSKVILEFFFFNATSSTGYWVLENMTYQDSNTNTKISLRPVDSIIVPITFSYHCSSDTTFRGNNTTIKFVNFQVQPYLEGNIVFGDAYNCELFFTAAIWSGIFVTSILALIMIWGLVMIMDIRTMDQFDDPKGKTITISATD